MSDRSLSDPIARSNHFGDRLAAAVRSKRSPIVVGLDPRFDLLPAELADSCRECSRDLTAAVVAEFCRKVIDIVADLVPAVKIQSAFFEAIGPEGLIAMAEVLEYARKCGLIVILDVKRGDIGSTAEAYADAYLGPEGPAPWPADAITVNPFLGPDTLEPFVRTAQARGGGIFGLVRTSNPGAPEFQDITPMNGKPVYRRIADWVQSQAMVTAGQSGLGIVGGVVGATYPQQLKELRSVMANAWLLVPGYGTQGATATDVSSAFRPDGLGALVNNSRGLIFAFRQPEYAEMARRAGWQAATRKATEEMLQQLRSLTPAGNL